MFVKHEIGEELIKEANIIRDKISDDLKVFICLLNSNSNFLFEIIKRYFCDDSFLHEIIKIVNNINKLGCFLRFSDVPSNKFKKLHASREKLELFYLVRGVRISHNDPLPEIMKNLKKKEINNCLNISGPISSLSRKYTDKTKHQIRNISIVKYDGDDKIRLEWQDMSGTNLLVLPDDAELVIEESYNNEKLLNFINFEGKMIVDVEFKSFKFLESRDGYSVISLLLLSYSLIHNIYESAFKNIGNKNSQAKLTLVTQLLQANFLNYLMSDKFKIIKQVSAGRETSASQELILSKFNEALSDYTHLYRW